MNKKIYIAAILLLMPLMMGAQVLKGSYFLENSHNRHRLNPAFMPYSGYFQLPAVGGLNVGVLSNLDVSTFLYPIDGQLYTFLNQNVPVEKFESRLGKYPYLDVSADISLINFGFFAGKTFWTFELGTKVNADIDLPRDLFTFMKKGSTLDGVYNIGQIRANASASVYAALGFSRELFTPGLRLGAKIRGIVPAAYAGVNLNNVRLTTSADKWSLNTDGTIHSAVMGLTLTDEDMNIDPQYDFTQIAPAGWGFSFDLGAEYSLKFDGFISGVSVSAAFTDLGMMSYDPKAIQAYSSNGQMDWTGLKLSLEEGKMDETFDELEKEFKKLLVVDKVEKGEIPVKSTLPSFYVGAEMPFLKNTMSIGALYSARMSYFHTRHELTVSYNLTPARWFSFGVNYSFLNVQKTLGWILELTPRVGPTLFLGSDYTFVEFAKAPVELGIPILPMSMRFNIQAGLSFAIGGGKKAHNLEKKKD